MAKYIVEESNYKKYEKNYLFPFINLIPGIVWSIPLHQKLFPDASWWMTFGLCAAFVALYWYLSIKPIIAVVPCVAGVVMFTALFWVFADYIGNTPARIVVEEIDSDALFGIDALKHQTILQKIIFFGCVIAGVLLNVLLPLFYQTPRIICIQAFMAFFMVGVAFGCNYTEDMTYGKYLYFFFFKPTQPLYFRSTEDVEKIREKAKELEREEELLLRARQQADPAAQRKLLIKLLAFVLVLAIAIGGVFIAKGVKDKNNIHHKADVITEVENE